MYGPPHFIDNKYRRWYFQIIEKARERTTTKEARAVRSPVGYEKHHLVPRSLGGLRFGPPDHLILLTYREHFLSHWLLTKFTVGEARKKMSNALWAMTRQRKVLTSWQYAVAREAHRSTLIGNQWARGYRHDAQTREKMSRARLGKKLSPEHCARISETRSRGKRGPSGIKRSAETRLKMSKPKSLKHRANISRALIGNKRATGRLLSEEAKARIGAKNRENMLGRKLSAEIKIKMSIAHQGKKLSPETVAKIVATRALRRRLRADAILDAGDGEAFAGPRADGAMQSAALQGDATVRS